MKLSFAGKRALVTGAGKGIGREIAVMLAECGARVVALTRSPSDLDSLAQEIGAEGIAVDLGDAAAAQHAAERAGAIDLLVNNAGISIPESFLNTSAESWDQTLAVNVRAALVVSQVVARGMVARRTGG